MGIKVKAGLSASTCDSDCTIFPYATCLSAVIQRYGGSRYLKIFLLCYDESVVSKLLHCLVKAARMSYGNGNAAPNWLMKAS
jgi:hypothetical protein